MPKAKPKNRNASQSKPTPAYRRKRWLPVALILTLGAIIVVGLIIVRTNRSASVPKTLPPVPTAPTATPAPDATPASELVTMDVAKAVMVTAELDFGTKQIPSIADALTQIERRYQPDDGQGRTFAVLDAYGESTPEGKLHISMHVSSEKPGGGQLIFKRTGEVLWRGKINPIQHPLPPKNLTILMDSGKGTTYTIDGSSNPASIIDAKVKPGDLPMRDAWPDGEIRELTFIYSACGCPVKVLVKREGDRTTRVKDTPVIFPDDPGAVQVISKLMRW